MDFLSQIAQEIRDKAPLIIEEVARELMPDRPIFYETEREIRFGNRGSFSVNKEIGVFCDHEANANGELLNMIMHLCGFQNKAQAVNWLKDKGLLTNTFTANPRRENNRPLARFNNSKTGTNKRGFFKEGLKLWKASDSVGYQQDHPVRRWCRHRDLFPQFRPIPNTIRWHDDKQLIIVALASVQGFIEAYPEPPQPQQFHLIAIDEQGKKRPAFTGNTDKRTWGRPRTTCVALFGNPNADEINICEGIADALALLSRVQGATIASITTFNKLIGCEALMRHLTANGRTVTLCADNDDAGKKAQESLARTLYERGGDVFVREGKAKDPAEEAKDTGWGGAR